MSCFFVDSFQIILITFQELPECSAQPHTRDMSESYKLRVMEEATIYKGKRRELTAFEKKVNSAAAELCLSDVSLLNRRGELLQIARQKASENYVFKKGRSQSKVYCSPDSAPKRPKYDKESREDRVKAIEEEVQDISRILWFKEKRHSQAEAARNYRTCEQLTEEMMGLKSRKKELQVEKRLFDNKRKRAQRRDAKKQQDSHSSDFAGSTPSTSRCDTPFSPFQSSLMSPPNVTGSVCSDLPSVSPEHYHWSRSPESHRHISPVSSPTHSFSLSPPPFKSWSPQPDSVTD